MERQELLERKEPFERKELFERKEPSTSGSFDIAVKPTLRKLPLTGCFP